MSRAAWLAAIAGGLLVVFRHHEEKLQIKTLYKKYTKRVWIIGCAILFAIAISLTGIYNLKKNSADGRLLAWKISLKTVVKHPLGIGLGNFSGVYGETQAEYFASGQARKKEEYVASSLEYAFNEYLQTLVESGIVAFLLFVAIVVLAFWSLLRTHAGMAGALLAMLVFAGFSYPFSLWEFLMVMCCLLAFASPPTLKWRGGKIASFAIYILLATIAAFIIYLYYPNYKAYQDWRKNRIYSYSEKYEDVVKTDKPLEPYLSDRIVFLFEYARSLEKTGKYEESNRVLQRATKISYDPMLYNLIGKNYQSLKDYKQAEENFIKSTNIVPNRLYPWYLLMKLYDDTAQTEKANETAKIVLTKEPKVQSIAIREMREEAERIRNKNFICKMKFTPLHCMLAAKIHKL
jgi:tetratricopeptide (TPR) repeat protein